MRCCRTRSGGVLYWFTYGMNNQREYKFCEVRQILKRCIEFHYTKSVTADLDMYRLVYETIARTLGHSVATSTEHYGTIANHPPSVNAADVLRSRHLGRGLASAGVASEVYRFRGARLLSRRVSRVMWMTWHLNVQLTRLALSMKRLRKLNPCVMILVGILFMQMMRLILFRICLWKFLA